jgi:hypothetical protein
MADVAGLHLTEKGAEARLRSLLEDLVRDYIGVRPGYQLALAVWFSKTLHGDVQHLLELFTGPPMNEFADPVQFSLLWKTGSQSPPFVEINATSVDYFSQQLSSNPASLRHFFEGSEVIYFDKGLLTEGITAAFNIVTEPAHLLKGWYVEDERARGRTTRDLVSSYGALKPSVGLLKTYESPDGENCRGLLHVEVGQRWVPLSANGLRNYLFYNDWLDGKPGFFLFKVGSLYRLLKFEERTEPGYSTQVLERLPGDRYPEVYLRAEHPSKQSAA